MAEKPRCSCGSTIFFSDCTRNDRQDMIMVGVHLEQTVPTSFPFFRQKMVSPLKKSYTQLPPHPVLHLHFTKRSYTNSIWSSASPLFLLEGIFIRTQKKSPQNLNKKCSLYNGSTVAQNETQGNKRRITFQTNH